MNIDLSEESLLDCAVKNPYVYSITKPNLPPFVKNLQGDDQADQTPGKDLYMRMRS